jgi:hypothetical protein
MMPQDMRDRLLKVFNIFEGKIARRIKRQENKVENAFKKSSLTIWETSPHQPLCHSMEYLFDQMRELKAHIERGSFAGVRLLFPAIRANWMYSFDRVDQELKHPRYHWRDEQAKRQAQQRFINAYYQSKGR